MNIKQGEIWEVEFFPNIGSEIGKKRPALVVNSNLIGKLPLKIVVPITEWSKAFANYPWIVNIQYDSTNGLSKESGIDCFQIRNFSIDRFIKKIGDIDDDFLFKIHQTIAKTLNPKYKLN
jgi:mRNA interferase MazF